MHAFNYRAVYSSKSKRIIVHYSAPRENSTQFGNPNYQVSSSDDGLQWSQPVSLDSQLGVICGRYLGTDGQGAEDVNGRLLMASYHRSNQQIVQEGRTACLYASDDGGEHWHVLSYPHAAVGSGRELGPWELSVVPIGADGQRLYLNGRHLIPQLPLGNTTNLPEPRIAGFSTDGGVSFQLNPTTEPAVDPDYGGSHFSALSVGRAAVLLAGPAGPAPLPLSPLNDQNNSGRRQMTLWHSDDAAQTWTRQLLEEGYAGYSALSLIPGAGAQNASSTLVGLLYERGSVAAGPKCEGSCSIGFLALQLGLTE